MSKIKNLQNEFINRLRKKRKRVEVYLINGIRLTGYIESFDQYLIMLRTHGGKQVIYKYAISTIQLDGQKTKPNVDSKENEKTISYDSEELVHASPKAPIARITKPQQKIAQRHSSTMQYHQPSASYNTYSDYYDQDDFRYPSQSISKKTSLTPAITFSRRRSYTIPPEDLPKESESN